MCNSSSQFPALEIYLYFSYESQLNSKLMIPQQNIVWCSELKQLGTIPTKKDLTITAKFGLGVFIYVTSEKADKFSCFKFFSCCISFFTRL